MKNCQSIYAHGFLLVSLLANVIQEKPIQSHTISKCGDFKLFVRDYESKESELYYQWNNDQKPILLDKHLGSIERTLIFPGNNIYLIVSEYNRGITFITIFKDKKAVYENAPGNSRSSIAFNTSKSFTLKTYVAPGKFIFTKFLVEKGRYRKK